MVEQDDLRLALLRRVLTYHEVSCVGVAVHKAMLEDHLREDVDQDVGRLERAFLSELALQLFDVVYPCASDKLHYHRARTALEGVLTCLWQVEVIVRAEIVASPLQVCELGLEV